MLTSLARLEPAAPTPNPNLSRHSASHLATLVRVFSCLIIAALVTACSNKKEPIQRLLGYEYPADSLTSGKLFTFKNKHANEFNFVEQQLVRENDGVYLLMESYSLNEKTSSDKFRITANGIEHLEAYLYRQPDSLSDVFVKDKAEILESINTDDGKKYSGSLTRMRIVSGNYLGNMTSRQTFLREDKMIFNNKEVDVLVFKSEITVSARHRFIPFFSSETVYNGDNYLARGIGLVRYSMNSDTEKSDWTLTKISNINDRSRINSSQ